VFWFCALNCTVGFSIGMTLGAWLRLYNPKRNAVDLMDSWWLVPLRRYVVWRLGKDGTFNVPVEERDRQGSC